MVSYALFYGYNHPDFNRWYDQWWLKNCKNCPYSSHFSLTNDNGYCEAEKQNMILDCKLRSQVYIAIDYHKHQKGTMCLLKLNIVKEEAPRDE